MSDLINIPTKSSGDTLSAGEVNTIVNKTNDAITEQNQTKIDHAEALSNKVDKVTGKGLSTEDYTTAEKTKLDGIEAGANNYIHPATHPLSMITETDELKVMTAAERTKLAGLSEHDKGFFVNEAAIVAAIPAGQAGWFCRNGETDTVWVWDVEGSAWVDTGSAGASSNSTIVEWEQYEPKPTITCDVKTGDFVEGKKHLVSFSTIDGEVVADIKVLNWVEKLFEINNYVMDLRLQPDGKVIVGGSFSQKIIRLNASGSLDLTFNASVPNDVTAIAIQTDGKIIVSYASSPFLSRLNADGSIDSSFSNSTLDNETFSLAITADSKIIALPSTQGKIHRFNADGSLDSSFDTQTFNSGGNGLAIQSDGKVLFGNTTGIFRMNADGTNDSSFTSPISGEVYTIAIQSSDKILIGGFFSQHLLRLNTDGSIDESFTHPIDDDVYKIEITPAGKIMITTTNSILRLNTDGSIDESFAVNSFGGYIYCSGLDSSMGMLLDYTTSGITRLNNDGSVDLSYGKKVVSYLGSLIERIEALEA